MMSWTMDDKEDHRDTASASWPGTSANSSNPPDRINTCSFVEHRGDELMVMNSLCSFKPTLNMMMEVVDDDDQWYNLPNTNTTAMAFSPTNFIDPENNHHHHHLLLHHPVDSSSSCSPSPSIFTTNFGGVADPCSSQVQYFLPPPPPPPPNPKSTAYNNNPFDIGCELGGFLEPQGSTTSPVLHHRGPSNSCSSSLLGSFIPHHDLASKNHFNTKLLPAPQGGFAGFRSFEEGSGKSPPLFLNRPKILRPLDDSLPPSGAQPTLFQKRAALRKNIMGSEEQQGGGLGKCEIVGEGSDSNNKKRRVVMLSSGDEMEDASFDGSALNYDSDDLVESNYNNNNNNKGVTVDENNAKNGGNSSMNGNSTIITGGVDQKGKKKGMPAKNLMAERRRRKKLNDRLYMLRSVVPKISKMDRASILGDAIEYLKELLQRINDLHNELESSTSGGSSLTPVSSFHPLTPTPPALPGRIKEEMCPTSLPSPNGQPARVEVRLREGRAVNIHMFCGRKPGLLLSTMRAMDNLGLDIQQAVISCFNGFAMDVFRAEQCKEGQEVHPEQIKAVLLDTAGYPGMI